MADDQMLDFLDSLASDPTYNQLAQQKDAIAEELRRWVPPAKAHLLNELEDAAEEYLNWHVQQALDHY